MAKDTVYTSIAKAVSWRAIATLVTMTVAYAVTKQLEFAATIGVADTIIKLGAYFAHERLWVRVRTAQVESPNEHAN